jgi:hypothetical protein
MIHMVKNRVLMLLLEKPLCLHTLLLSILSWIGILPNVYRLEMHRLFFGRIVKQSLKKIFRFSFQSRLKMIQIQVLNISNIFLIHRLQAGILRIQEQKSFLFWDFLLMLDEYQYGSG